MAQSYIYRAAWIHFKKAIILKSCDMLEYLSRMSITNDINLLTYTTQYILQRHSFNPLHCVLCERLYCYMHGLIISPHYAMIMNANAQRTISIDQYQIQYMANWSYYGKFECLCQYIAMLPEKNPNFPI